MAAPAGLTVLVTAASMTSTMASIGGRMSSVVMMLHHYYIVIVNLREGQGNIKSCSGPASLSRPSSWSWMMKHFLSIILDYFLVQRLNYYTITLHKHLFLLFMSILVVHYKVIILASFNINVVL